MILVDTNILVAVANRRDSHHQSAVELLEIASGPLLVAPTVIAEVCYLLHERAGAQAEVRFLQAFEAGDLDLADLTLGDLQRAALIAERMRIVEIATLDRRHFGVIRPSHVDYFTLLPKRTAPAWTAASIAVRVIETNVSRHSRCDAKRCCRSN